jgi:hypothetical protein
VRLREYLLTLEGFKVSGADKTGMPIELAESWFEIQDLLMEDPISAQKRLSAFEIELNQFKLQGESKLKILEKSYDDEPSPIILKKIAHEIQSQSYLKSMEKDVERIKKNAYSN